MQNDFEKQYRKFLPRIEGHIYNRFGHCADFDDHVLECTLILWKAYNKREKYADYPFDKLFWYWVNQYLSRENKKKKRQGEVFDYSIDLEKMF